MGLVDYRKTNRVSGFQSKAEKSLYQLLWLRQRAGEIRNLKCQVQVYLTEAKILYKPDFYFEQNDHGEWKERWSEMKGFETAVWKIKRRLWMFYGPGPLDIWKLNRSGIFFSETIDVKNK